MVTFYKLYSMVFISIIMISGLHGACKNINKKDFWAYIIGIMLFMPVWYYIVYYSYIIH